MLKLNAAQCFFKKLPKQFLLKKYAVQNKPQKSQYFWATFATIFVKKTFQKSSNVVTLTMADGKNQHFEQIKLIFVQKNFLEQAGDQNGAKIFVLKWFLIQFWLDLLRDHNLTKSIFGGHSRNGELQLKLFGAN